MNQAHGLVNMHRYMLQPGDATKYRFFLADLVSLIEVQGTLGQLISGTNRNYLTIGICMPGSQGTYEMRRNEVRDPSRSLAQYLAAHMGNADLYTVCAVLLAASVLVDDPDNLQKACEKMLEAHQMMTS